MTYLLRFREEFEKPFSEICKIQEITKWIQENDEDEFAQRLGQVVYVFMRRYKQVDEKGTALYLSLLTECVIACRQASKSLQTIIQALRGMDGTDVEFLFAYAALTFEDLDGLGPRDKDELSRLTERLKSVVPMVQAIGLTLEQMGVGVMPSGKGRPSVDVRLYFPVLRLMNLWRDLTHSPIPQPRSAAGMDGAPRQAITHSGQFVELAMQMVDPNISAAKIRTTMRYALKDEGALQREWDSAVDISSPP